MRASLLVLGEEVAYQSAFVLVFDACKQFRAQSLNCLGTVEWHPLVNLPAVEVARLAPGFEDLIWVEKSTFAEIFPASVVGFPGEFAAVSAAEEFAIAPDLVAPDSGTLEFEDALVPAFVWPHP